MTSIVVTGIGLVSPAGVDLETSCASTYPLPVTQDFDQYPDHVDLPAVLPVPGHFSLRHIVKKRKDIKLMARANQYAVAACDEAIRHAKLSPEALEQAGIFMAVGREPSDLKALLPSVVHSVHDDTLDLSTLFQHGVDWINPLSSLKTLPNMSLAHTAIHIGARGPNMTLFGPDAFDDCVHAAIHSIQAGRCTIALVGGADSCTSFYDRLGIAREHPYPEVGEGAGIFVIETVKNVRARGGHPVAQIVDLKAKTSQFHLGYCGAATNAMNIALKLGRANGAQSPDHTPPPSIVCNADKAHRVLVTGVGIVSPLGLDFDTFRERIRHGASAVGPITQFDADQFAVRNACEVHSDDWWTRLPKSIQAELAIVSERSASFAVSAALSAVQDAGIVDTPDIVVYGTGLSSVSIPELNQDCLPYLTAEKPYLDFQRVTVNCDQTHFVSPHRHRMSLPLEVLSKYWRKTVDQHIHFSACAAGAGAIGHGLDLVRTGLRRTALVGASDAMIHPYGLIPFSKLGATSTIEDPALAARPFDKNRSGFVMGETAAFFMLESEESALSRGAKVYGELAGWGSSCDAHNVTAPHPEGLGAKASMSASLKDAGLKPNQIDYVNAHGTGTHLNDTAEAHAIARLFGTHRPWVSSTKSQLGHCIGAAGAIEFAVCLSALLDGYIPPNISLFTPEPNLGVRLSGRSSIKADVQFVMSNSFGFGGQNVSLIVGRA